MTTTIYVYLEEQHDGSLLAFWYPPMAGTSPAREAFAASLSLNRQIEGDGVGKNVGTSILEFEVRLVLTGKAEGFKVRKVGATKYKLTQTKH